ncbi:hypothetical protein PybrP1_004475 [[Pythium] brassicae (nom. inval.)]|nr:hypothetical protein PybrP1_004475 [[Pythium] brassicae (nom. inval.)]
MPHELDNPDASTLVARLVIQTDWLLQQRCPSLNWAFVYIVGVIYAFAVRCTTTPSLIDTFGTKEDDTIGVKVAGFALGLLEDLIWLNYLVLLLWPLDVAFASCLKGYRVNGLRDCFEEGHSARSRALLIAMRFSRFVAWLLLFTVWAVPIAADSVLMRTRSMRFTFEFVEMYLNDKSAAGSLQVSKQELAIAYEMIGATAAVAIAFALVAVVWIDLTLWSPLHLFAGTRVATKSECEKSLADANNVYVVMEQGCGVNSSAEVDAQYLRTSTSRRRSERKASLPAIADKREEQGDNVPAPPVWAKAKTAALILFVLVALPLVELVTACACPTVIAHVALNTDLNELFRIWFCREFLPGPSSSSLGSTTSDNYYIRRDTEIYTAFGDEVLYRRTTGFKGDLAFDVKVDQGDLPNVLVIAVESFRYHDSQYLVGNSTYLLKDKNITVTPNFDRWAKRGIAFRNFWSSWRTSRSVESVLFAQIPYDSLTDSGTTGGRKRVRLAGMPQLLKAKGYEPTFTTGCRTDYDQWDKFLPSHGFDEVYSMNEFKALAEQDLGIQPKDWALAADGGRARAMSYWGVHDDVSFEVLGNMLMNKTAEQKMRVANNQPKKPFFINHYTISSHSPFRDSPEWYVNASKPDFSALYKDERNAEAVKNYLELRYFTDMALGKFLDRMAKHGVLNDTIVFITGDHGQAPEYGFDLPEARQISATRVAAALIAEGRLGESAGMIFDDAAAQYDLLNTVADIVGVPGDGFIQSGVGRSLKRKVPFGERAVWSNNPSQKLSAVRGHERLQFDRITSEMELYDADTDNEQTRDLYPALTDERKQEAKRLRDAGRRLNMYFKTRWDKECILRVDCK